MSTRSFVIVGRTARASADVRLEDLPGTSGRLDVLLRCVRAGLLTSHGLRRDAVVYLVLLGGDAPKTIRIDGATAKFLRPDERALATLMLKTIARAEHDDARFVPQRLGLAVACAGLDAVLAELRGARLFLLDEGAPDLRGLRGLDEELAGDTAFFVGDHLGFDEPTLASLRAAGARPVGLGPVSVHSDDAVTLVSNELDRRPPSTE